MNTKDRFLKETKFCEICGSQRCDQSYDWIDGCGSYKMWLDKEFRKVLNQDEDNTVKFVQIWT